MTDLNSSITVGEKWGDQLRCLTCGSAKDESEGDCKHSQVDKISHWY